MKNSNIKKYIIIFISMIALLVATIFSIPKSTKEKSIKFKNDSNIETKLISEVFSLVEKQLPNYQDLGFVNIKNKIKNSKTKDNYSMEYIFDSDTSGSFYITADKSKTSEFEKVWQLSYLTMYHLIYKIDIGWGWSNLELENVGSDFTKTDEVAAYAYALYIQDLFFKSKTYLNYKIESLENNSNPDSKFKKEIMKKYLDLKNGLKLEMFIEDIKKSILFEKSIVDSAEKLTEKLKKHI